MLVHCLPPVQESPQTVQLVLLRGMHLLLQQSSASLHEFPQAPQFWGLSGK